ncbi:unnamed protein product, partial [Iphiclides podalirius]
MEVHLDAAANGQSGLVYSQAAAREYFFFLVLVSRCDQSKPVRRFDQPSPRVHPEISWSLCINTTAAYDSISPVIGHARE